MNIYHCIFVIYHLYHTVSQHQRQSLLQMIKSLFHKTIRFFEIHREGIAIHVSNDVG